MLKNSPLLFPNFLKKAILIVLLSVASAGGYAQENIPEYDELVVELTVPDLGVMEIPIAIKGQEAFISLEDLFELLKIKAERTEAGIEGFIIHPDSTYFISPSHAEVIYQDEVFSAENALIETPASLYLRSDFFGKIFGLNTDFSFRNLSITMKTEHDLPAIKEMKREKMRENLAVVKGIVEPDTILPKTYPFFRAGSLDWGIVTTQQSEIENDNRFTLGLGTMIAGGETNLMLNYSTRVPFQSRNQFYQWRYVNNDNSYLKQVTAGRIFTRATSSLFAPVAGIQLSNSPMNNRRSFGTYTLSDHTDPHWIVELYVNNVLVDFTEADASGFYSFEVPLMYGNTAVNLRFYGPWGEERVKERLINIPYNFVPKNEFEYTLSAGIVENDDHDRFSRLNLNYGISNAITVGGGVEYLSEVTSGEVMPFINSSIKLASNLLFSGEYMYGVKGDALLSYRSPKSLQVDLNYVNYDKDQTAINYNYLEERKINISAPIRTRNFSIFSRFSLNQIIMPTTEFTTAQLLLSGAIFGISTNLTTYGIYNDRIKTPTIYSTLSQTYRMPYRWLFSPQLQFDFNNTRFNNIVLEVERPVFRGGYFNLAYENNTIRDAHIFEVGLRYTFNFAQTAFTSRIGNRNNSFVQSARGSIILDDNTGFVTTSNRSAMSKGGLTITPFLDYNLNGKKDDLEPKVPGLELKNQYGRVVYNKDRTEIRVMDLQPYVDLLLEIDTESLDNIAWKVSNPKIAVETVPNYFKEIQVPVQVLGEVSGMVYIKSNSRTRGQGRIIINILDENNRVAASVLSEGDGYFTFLGLKPGNYKAQVDTEQLEALGYASTSSEVSFEIEISEFGDIVHDLEFTLEDLN